MMERIREIGGSLKINPSAIGTEIVARVPARHTHEVLRPERKR